MKQKLITVSIILLIILIGIIQFYSFKIGKSSYSNEKIKSSYINLQTQSFSDFGIENIQLIPNKKSNYIEPNIWAKSYILLDNNSAYPLAEKNSHTPVSIASTTKIMTAIIALENYNLNDVITVSQNSATQIGSEVMLKTGEKITVESLLYALLVQSGNDSAMALAEHYQDKGLDGFIRAMNAKAAYLGLRDTEFKDPAGLDDTGHVSAFGLAIITSYALKNQVFSKIVKTSEITIASNDGKFVHKLDSSNRLIKSDEPLYYPYAIGIKTGFTPDAGHCLVAAAEKNGHRLISVILNTFDSSNDASARESRKLLKWGFDNYQI